MSYFAILKDRIIRNLPTLIKVIPLLLIWWSVHQIEIIYIAVAQKWDCYDFPFFVWKVSLPLARDFWCTIIYASSIALFLMRGDK